MAAYCQVYGVIHFTLPAGWLPVHRGQLRAQRSVTSMGKLYLFTLFTYLFSYLFIVIDFCQTIYLNIYWTDLHQICKDGRTTALEVGSSDIR